MGLLVYVDGTPMPEADARAFWQRFSDWMEENKGDLAGFAAKEGFTSVHPGVENGRPVLRASRSSTQQPYAPVDRSGGSPSRHEPAPAGARPRKNPSKSGRKGPS
jgi:hypothetical protein